MTNKPLDVLDSAAAAADEFESLYLRLLDAFYEKEDREEAHKAVERLEAILAERPEFAESIRAEEVRSLAAELRGDLAEAIRRREREIDKIRRLHGLAVSEPTRSQVFQQYDASDLSDRIDLLAGLCADWGDLDRAVELLEESKRLCEAHGVPFDGQDMLDEYELVRRQGGGV